MLFSCTFRCPLICLEELARRGETTQAGGIASRHGLSPDFLAHLLARWPICWPGFEGWGW